jgi:hypothetical protein
MRDRLSRFTPSGNCGIEVEIGFIVKRVVNGASAESLAYRKLDEAVGPTSLPVAPVCPQCVWKNSAANSASVLGLPSISPDIIRSMTTSCIASRKASPSLSPQSLLLSVRKRKAATIFDAPSESDLSAGACGVGCAVVAGQAVAITTSERTAQAQPPTGINSMTVDPSAATPATRRKQRV